MRPSGIAPGMLPSALPPATCHSHNIELFFIPPYTPEMNPIEQIWKELRKMGFRNELFATLSKVVDRLCE
ncbi:MAG: transposase, partial [Oscillospiraceae bacterium]|nr:transposase [Oscillospiraceae bacterium]